MIEDFDRVSLHDVCRYFGRRNAVSGVSFAAKAGEILGLVGPNGAGKSTLLALVSTLLTPSSGEIRYGSKTARTAGPHVRACLGLLAHDLHVYADLTGRENLEFFARLHGATDRLAARIADALARAALSDRADDSVSTYSRGMRQRLALECALVHDPRLLLLDEPFTGLDEAGSAALVERLRGLRSDGGILVIATHDLETAGELFDHAVLMKQGRSTAMLPGGADLRERYRHLLASS